MFWITEDHFQFVGLFDWGNAETQTFSVSRNRHGFALAESQTRKSGTVAPLVLTTIPVVQYSDEVYVTVLYFFIGFENIWLMI